MKVTAGCRLVFLEYTVCKAIYFYDDEEVEHSCREFTVSA
jgi:hypothetical protein